jgi:hypothetical protein
MQSCRIVSLNQYTYLQKKIYNVYIQRRVDRWYIFHTAGLSVVCTTWFLSSICGVLLAIPSSNPRWIGAYSINHWLTLFEPLLSKFKSTSSKTFSWRLEINSSQLIIFFKKKLKLSWEVFCWTFNSWWLPFLAQGMFFWQFTFVSSH